MRASRLLLACALLAPAPGGADTRITMRVVGNGASTAEPAITETWFAPGRLRQDQGGFSVIVDLAERRVAILDHARKSYTALAIPVDLKALLPPDLPDADRFLEQMSMQLTVTPSDERREVRGYPARKYAVTMSNQLGVKLSQELWLTREVGFDLAAYKALAAVLARLQPLADPSRLEALDGFPVLQTTSIAMGGATLEATEELVAIENAPAPAGCYAVPTDYVAARLDVLSVTRP
ncbi:MAG TPA: DUF4412 domain-containing protein [Candidatus Polarisedimenticolaceae bacterium]|nr:DUF4412 domain-containing protein [Candidatus Polarisedimenticolaceae bacterium]